MTLHMTLYVATGEEDFATQSTVIWIFPSMNIYVAICVVVHTPFHSYIMSLQYIFYVALPVTSLTLFIVLQGFYPDCNDLTAEITMVLS